MIKKLLLVGLCFFSIVLSAHDNPVVIKLVGLEPEQTTIDSLKQDSILRSNLDEYKIIDSTATQKVVSTYIDGITQMIGGNPEYASYFKRALALDPNHAASNYQYGMSQYGVNNKLAIDYVTKAYTLDPNEKSYAWIYAMMQINSGNEDEAIEVLQTLHKNHFEDTKYIYALLSIYNSQGRSNKKASLKLIDDLETTQGYSQQISNMRLGILDGSPAKLVEKEYKRSIAAYPLSVSNRLHLINWYETNEDYSKASKLLKASLEKFPDNGRLIIYKADLKEDQGMSYAELEPSYLKAIEDVSLDSAVRVLHMRKIVYNHKDSISYVKSLLKSWAKLYGNEEDLWNLNYSMAQQWEDTTMMKQSLERVLQINPTKVEAIVLKASIAEAEHDDPTVFKTLRYAQEIFPTEMRWYIGEIGFYITQGDSLATLAHLDTMIQTVEPMNIPQNTVQLISLKAQLLGQYGQIDESLKTYEWGYQTDSTYIELLNNYAYVLADQGLELERAEKMISYVIDKDPGNANFLDTYAWTFYKLHQYRDAAFYIERSLSATVSVANLEHAIAIYKAWSKPEKVAEYEAQLKKLNL